MKKIVTGLVLTLGLGVAGAAEKLAAASAATLTLNGRTLSPTHAASD